LAEKREKYKTTITFGSVPLEDIIFDTNIRSDYPNDDIDTLADSMCEYGQLEHIRAYKQDDKYVVIFGHRRCLAAKMAGLDIILVDIVKKPEKKDVIYMQAIEN